MTQSRRTDRDRVMEKFGEIYWPRILIEGVVIAAIILLVLATDAWWDSVQERAVERRVLRIIFWKKLTKIERVTHD